MTSLDWRQARADVVADAVRGHWEIEALHWIRDVTFGEDLSQIRTGHGPATMAGPRNFAVSRHRLNAATNIGPGLPADRPAHQSRAPPAHITAGSTTRRP